jgi:hypothetical protein
MWTIASRTTFGVARSRRCHVSSTFRTAQANRTGVDPERDHGFFGAACNRGSETSKLPCHDGQDRDVIIDMDETGTIDWLLLEFKGKKVTGELLPPLLDLVEHHLIRVLDALILLKAQDGSLQILTTEELDAAAIADLGELAGASSGLLSEEDAVAAAEVLEPGSASLLIVYENLWSIPFARAARRAGGQVVASGRIPVQAILAQLDALEADEA